MRKVLTILLCFDLDVDLDLDMEQGRGHYPEKLLKHFSFTQNAFPSSILRIPDSYDAKIANIRNFWKLWPVIQLINHLFKIRQKAFLPNAAYL